MAAPPVELLIRAANAAMATVTFCLLTWGLLTRHRYPAWPLMAFLAFVVGVQMVWRYFILWLGFQTDLGHWGWIVPWVQPLNASLLFLLFLAVGLTAYFHLRRMIPPDHPGGSDG